MKLSWAQIKYTLSMNWLHLVSDVKMIPFKIQLRWLCWRKGGGQNVTAEDMKGMPPLIEGGPDAAIALLRIVAVYEICQYLYKFFNVPKENQSVGIYIAHFAMGSIEDVELCNDIEKLVDSDDVRAKIYGWMRRADEISDAAVAVARVRPEWNELVAWYKTKVDKRGKPIENPTNPTEPASSSTETTPPGV